MSQIKLRGITEKKDNDEIQIENKSKIRENSGNVLPNTWENDLWIQNRIKLNTKLKELLYFFSIESPSVPGKASSKQFTNLYEIWGETCFGPSKDSLKSHLSKFLIKGLLDNTEGIAQNSNDILDRINSFNLGPLDLNSLSSIDMSSRVVMVDSQKNQYLSLFRHIRNSISHGSFRFFKSKQNMYYVFQDVDSRGNVSARGIIDIEILISWKRIILKEHLSTNIKQK